MCTGAENLDQIQSHTKNNSKICDEFEIQFNIKNWKNEKLLLPLGLAHFQQVAVLFDFTFFNKKVFLSHS